MTVVAVLSMKGGVGKSTVTLGLASAAWARDLTALVIDLDPQANTTMAIDVPDATFTTSDVLADARPGVAQDAITPSGWGSGVSVIATSPPAGIPRCDFAPRWPPRPGSSTSS